MKITVYKDKLKISSSLRTEPIQLLLGGVEGPFFTLIALYYIIIPFWHQAIAEHFDFLVGKVVMSLKCLIICALLQVALLWVHPQSAE